MKQTQETFTLPDKDSLVNKLISSGYAFASWRMPNETQSQLIISLKSQLQVIGTQVSELEPGFIANNFSDGHPIAPFFIKADIIVKEDEVIVDPTVNDSQIDELKAQLQKEVNSELGLPYKATTTPTPKITGAAGFKEKVAKAVKDIKEEQFEKVVLSRYLDQELPTNFSLWKYFKLLCSSYPNAFCSLTFIPGMGVWVGATPELLISDNQERFKTVALAGTKKLDDGQSLSEIAWTQKEIEEQAFVSRYIINCFKKIRLREFHEHGPKTIKAGSLAHLKTTFEVNYREVSYEGLSDQMLDLLHPTSAVCGMPIETAKPWIAAHEDYDRELYSGFLGPVNYEHSTDLFVNLRCAKISGEQIRFYAGAGITEDSNPEKELEETEMKINVLRNILNN